MRVHVDREKCCASGQCVVSAPDVFDQSPDDGRVLLVLAAPPAGLDGPVREAADCCPAGAITVAE
ncbi:ferredoxin [Streptomyces sp. M19]